VFKGQKVLKKPQEPIATGSFKMVNYSVSNFIAKLRLFKAYIRQQLTQNDYDTVIISGNLVFPLISIVKKTKPNIPVIADIHGTIDELIEFKGKNLRTNLLRNMFYRYAVFVGKKELPKFDGYFAVSTALKRHVQDKFNVTSDNFFIIPCGTNINCIDVNLSAENRAKYRQRYGISDDETVFIYSGGVSPWQCIEESVNLYDKIKSTGKFGKTRLCIFSGQLSAIEHFKRKDIIVGSLSSNEVAGVLNMGDFAFMLRGDYMTNRVAYPNKFLEYVAGGLQVIATNYVEDVRDQIIEYNLGNIVGLDGSGVEDICNNKPFMSDVASRNDLLMHTGFVCTLKPFVEYIGANKIH
jgi:glycosyltransferase involved in cell wall biosynthesis